MFTCTRRVLRTTSVQARRVCDVDNNKMSGADAQKEVTMDTMHAEIQTQSKMATAARRRGQVTQAPQVGVLPSSTRPSSKKKASSSISTVPIADDLLRPVRSIRKLKGMETFSGPKQKPSKEELAKQSNLLLTSKEQTIYGSVFTGNVDFNSAKMDLSNPGTQALLRKPKKYRESLRRELCTQTLANGHLDAYRDLFRLTHRGPVVVNELANETFEIPTDQFPFLKESLSAAEDLILTGDTESFRGSYQYIAEIAEYFESNLDILESTYFREKNLSRLVAVEADPELQGQALEDAAKAYIKQGRLTDAIHLYEEHLEGINAETASVSVVDSIRRSLIGVYEQLAHKQEDEQDFIHAVLSYEAALGHLNQTRSEDTAGERDRRRGEMMYRIGLCYQQCADEEHALKLFVDFRELCRKTKNLRSEGIAMGAMANVYKRMGNMEQAIRSLERYFEIGVECGDTGAQVSSAQELGEMYMQESAPEKAVEYFQKAFAVASHRDDKEAARKASINLGAARGQAGFKKFTTLLNSADDPTSDAMLQLLDWKSNRTTYHDWQEKDDDEAAANTSTDSGVEAEPETSPA